jgi:thiol-disulfide isomerase/thioredoxin
MLRLVLAGDTASARVEAASAVETPVPALPAFTLTDLDGRPVTADDLKGKAVLVEFWATWCPPCRGTLAWLNELQRRHAGKLVVLAAAIESDEADVRRIRDELGLELRVAMGTPEMARAFGDLSAVPTLFVFDRQGRTLGSFFGAPPGLHTEVEQALGGSVSN